MYTAPPSPTRLPSHQPPSAFSAMREVWQVDLVARGDRSSLIAHRD
ncbi:predicted protein [Plenodomus lingam JN3]|uniref:Predicted protein n=1 Tax=Leptosphaeria maculans (strain JN3 / isolate v23.1.3 / race Av1-4-5-6-7-8) TaxID=985895 RepID=E4ZUJ9_LEPMJ|nr:predicted protein [Plenodomus lingam JN3]CBX95078.1 predicted protein [Plenodomus lingam JN3]